MRFSATIGKEQPLAYIVQILTGAGKPQAPVSNVRKTLQFSVATPKLLGLKFEPFLSFEERNGHKYEKRTYGALHITLSHLCDCGSQSVHLSRAIIDAIGVLNRARRKAYISD